MYSDSAALLHTQCRLVFRAPEKNHGCAGLTPLSPPAHAHRQHVPERDADVARRGGRTRDCTLPVMRSMWRWRVSRLRRDRSSPALRAAASSAEVSTPLRAADTAGAGGAGANQGGPPAREPVRQLRRVGRRRPAARTHRRAPSGACVRRRPPEPDGAFSSRRARALVCGCAHAHAGECTCACW